MTFFLDAAFKNARRLNLPKRHIGVSWSDIVDFCDDYLNAGESEENINKKLTKAIVALQNATFDKKNLVEKKSVVIEKPVGVEKPVGFEKPVGVEKPVEMWQIYQKRPESFDTFTFSVYPILGFVSEFDAKSIMSLVIGRGGCFFKEWTAYWNAGNIMYHRKTMTIEVSFLKMDPERYQKFQVMRNFIIGKIDWNAKKYFSIRK